MGDSRRAAIALALCLGALLGAPAGARATDPPPDPEPVVAGDEPMSWWGFWTGVHAGDRNNGIKYLKQNWPAKFGTNFVLTGTNVSVAKTTRTVQLAQERGTGVVLFLGSLFDRGCAWTRGTGYGADDYAAWEADLTTLARALAPYKGTIIAIVGFDDMNGKAPLCYFSQDGQPNPVSESMRLAAAFFPEVAQRGHVWMAGGWGAGDANVPYRSAEWLEHSTMLFPYAYHGAFRFDWDKALVTDCPRKGDLPRSQLPDSYAARNVADLHAFVDWVGEQPGHESTPVLFIGNASQHGFRRAPVFADGVACTFESTYYHLRCLTAADPAGWSSRVRGVMGFAWNTNDTFGGLSWIGAAQVPELKQTGRWLATHRETCTFSAQRDYEDSTGGQRYWRWRYEQCAVDDALLVLDACARLPQQVDGVWKTADGTGRIDATIAAPPANRNIAVARRWTAPANGTVTVRVRLGDSEPSPPCTAITDDGARAAIYRGTTRVWPATGWQLVKNGSPVDVTLTDLAVSAGDALRFVVQRGTSPPGFHFCDATQFSPEIEFTW